MRNYNVIIHVFAKVYLTYAHLLTEF